MRKNANRLGLLVLVTLTLSSVLSGEEAQPVTSENPTATLSVEELRAEGEDLARLRQRVLAADGERRNILRAELSYQWGKFTTSLDESVAAFEDLQPGDAERSAAHDLLGEVAAVLLNAATVLEREVSEVEHNRNAAAEEDLDHLTREADRAGEAYHGILRSILDHTDRMHSLAAPGAPELLASLDQMLRERVEILRGRVRFLSGQRDEVQELVSNAATDDEKAALNVELSRLDRRLQSSATGLSELVEIMERRGMEVTEEKELVLLVTGDVGAAVLDTEVAVGLVGAWIEKGKIWLAEQGPRMLIKVVFVLLVLIVFWVIARVTSRVVRRVVTSSRFDMSQLLRDFFVTMTYRFVLLIGVLVALSQLGVEVGPLLAGLGIVGFVVGFALQDTLSNFASGLMILLYRPYDVSDAIEAAGVLGVVSEMNLVSTTIKTFDNQKVIVPNGAIWGGVVRNLTAEETRRVDLTFGIGYEDDIDKAERVLHELVEAHDLVLAEPEPVIKLSNLGDSSVDFIVRPWTRTADYWTAYCDLTRAVKVRFGEEGISIPFPQQDVHMHGEK